MSQFKLLLQVALRNLLLSRMNLLIGGIIFFGTLVVVVGGALLDSVDRSMSRSIIGSIAGHLQVYSDKSTDELALFGQMGRESDLAAIEDFSRIKEVVGKHPNVKTVVPMGINAATIMSGNTVDQVLANLRDLYRQHAEKGETPELRTQLDNLRGHVRHMVSVLDSQVAQQTRILEESATDVAEREALTRARSEEFWADFEKDPFASLEFLENRIAPLVADGDQLTLRFVGTDLNTFQQNFDRMRIVDGTAVPQGRRGMLLSKFFYEQSFKLKTAYRLDSIKEGRDVQRQTLARSPNLKQLVNENRTQLREILFQLDPIKTGQARERLQRLLGSQEQDLSKLLAEFFTMDDANFDTRYQQFYAELAPLLQLYRIRPGEDLAITTVSRNGYAQSLNVRIYGTYEFQGLERSASAGSFSLMDLMSFRDLYGHLSAERKEELAQLQKDSGLEAVARESAESEFFGEGSTLVEDAAPVAIQETGLEKQDWAQRRAELLNRVYTQEELENGMVLNAAVLLKDPTQLARTMAELGQSTKAAELPLRVVSWQRASGLIGQLVMLAKLVLYFAVFIIFVVALVIINNAMMMATLQRAREVGTMRAIGAQRSFILNMVLVETLVLGLLFGLGGALGGGAIVRMLGTAGIPASSPTLYLFFSGPKLFPELGVSNLVVAFVIVTMVSALSTLYPAFLATRVSPITAMQTDE